MCDKNLKDKMRELELLVQKLARMCDTVLVWAASVRPAPEVPCGAGCDMPYSICQLYHVTREELCRIAVDGLGALPELTSKAREERWAYHDAAWKANEAGLIGDKWPEELKERTREVYRYVHGTA